MRPRGSRCCRLRRRGCLRSGRVLSQERAVLRRLGPVGRRLGSRGISGRSSGRRRLRGSCPVRVTGGDIDRTRHRADVQTGGLAERASLRTVVAGNGDDEIVTVDDDLGAGNAETVDAGLDDFLSLLETVLTGSAAVRGTSGQRDARSTLQVDAEFRRGRLVSSEEHQGIQCHHQDPEKGQVADRMHRSGGRCHDL